MIMLRLATCIDLVSLSAVATDVFTILTIYKHLHLHLHAEYLCYVMQLHTYICISLEQP